MTDETTSEQLAEIEGQAEDTPATEYTPPDGWRLLAVGELVMLDDQWVRQDGSVWRSMGTEGPVSEGARYIRRIEPEPVWVCEGRWRTRGGDIHNVTPTPEGDRRKERYPWWDAQLFGTWAANGRYYSDCEDSPLDLVEYLGPIEEQTEPQPEPVQVPDADEQIRLLKECNARQAELIADLKYERSGAMERAEVSARGNRKLTEQIEELRSEVSYVQNLLGESRQRVTHLEELVGRTQDLPETGEESPDQLIGRISLLRRRVTELEELVTSLRTINEAQEKAFEAAGKENTALRNQLTAVKAELASVAADRQQLRVELDAAQQVPADSPELRQLRADLAEVTRERDQYLDSYQRIFGDLETIRETTKAETVEAIVEWLEPVRATIEAADNVQQTMRADNLACDIIRNLPGILRYVVGLNHPEEIE